MRNLDILQIIGTNLIWQTALVGAAVFVALQILPRAQAKARYKIALTGLLGTLLLLAAPFLPELAPNLAVGVTPSPPLVAAAIPTIPETFFIEPARQVQTNKSQNLPPIGTLLIGLWALGTALMLFRLSFAAQQGATWRKQAKRAHISGKALSKPVRILRSQHIKAPMVMGFLRPAILVPQDFGLDVSDPQTRAVLEHEIAHITRGDLWVNLAQRLVLALLWWCAPLYWVNAQIGVEREKLCDDIAASKAGKGRALARALVDLADAHIKTPAPLLAIGIHPKAGLLAERVQRLCSPKNIPVISKKLLLTSSLAVPLTIAALTTLTPRAFADHPHKANAHYDYSDENPEITSLQYALYYAAEHGLLSEAGQLLDMGTNPNFALPGDGTPLIAAVHNGNEKLVRRLIKAGADVNLISPGDGSPLIAAAYTGDTTLINLLTAKGANVNLSAPGDGNPLIASAHGNDTDTAKLLLSLGANINAQVIGDETPLINAAQGGHLNMVEFLITEGAEINLGMWADGPRGRHWRTPLGEANRQHHQGVVRFLKAQGAVHEAPKTNHNSRGALRITTGKISSRYGIVRDGKIHHGIDIANKRGTPIYAPADGQISVFNEFSFRKNYGPVEKYGKTLELKTAGGVTTLFAHLQDFAVAQGALVKAGDLIAYMGNTGVSSGPHVHIETHIDGDLVDPLTVWPNIR